MVTYLQENLRWWLICKKICGGDLFVKIWGGDLFVRKVEGWWIICKKIWGGDLIVTKVRWPIICKKGFVKKIHAYYSYQRIYYLLNNWAVVGLMIRVWIFGLIHAICRTIALSDFWAVGQVDRTRTVGLSTNFHHLQNI